jgi:CRP-like cAMP-binding protein
MDSSDHVSPLVLKAINKVGSFNRDQIDHIVSKGKFIHLAKESVILKPNQVCQSAFLVIHGSIKQLVHVDDLECTRGLFVSGDWVMDVESFTAQSPAKSTIFCHTDCLLFELGIHAIHGLITQSNAYIQLGRLLSMIPDNQIYHLLSPEAKYNKLLSERPDLLQAFPLKTIASYLEITPETLSRVRGKKIK